MPWVHVHVSPRGGHVHGPAENKYHRIENYKHLGCRNFDFEIQVILGLERTCANG